jgi:predicted Zn-dependent peptidase
VLNKIFVCIGLSDLIHKAAYSGGLSRSLYAPRFNVDNIDSSMLQEFRRRNFSNDRLTLVGVGIQHEELIRYTDLFRLNAASSGNARPPSKYIGGELRHDSDSELVHVALAHEGSR